MSKEVSIEDNSGDKSYFTMVPNFILNHSTAIDQALYLQMKRMAGEKGQCYASEKTLMVKMGIGRKALKKSLDYLLKREWITFIGYKYIETNGGVQTIKSYSIKDIWEQNSDYYRGVSKSAGLLKRTSKGCPKEQQRRTTTKKILPAKAVSNKMTYEEPTLNNETGEVEKPQKSQIGESYNNLLKWAENERGQKFIQPLKQFKAMKILREAGISIPEIKQRWKEMQGEEFYKKVGIDFMMVVSSLNKKR